MTRFYDWPERLNRFIAERAKRRFEWGKGKQDCCSFANQGVAAITGDDLMFDIPEYASAEEADLILADTSLTELMDLRLPRRASIGLAQRGDVCLAVLKGQETLMLCDGETIIGPGLKGLVRLDRGAIRVAWAVI